MKCFPRVMSLLDWNFGWVGKPSIDPTDGTFVGLYCMLTFEFHDMLSRKFDGDAKSHSNFIRYFIKRMKRTKRLVNRNKHQ